MTQVFFDPRQFVAGQQVQRDVTARNALADLAPAAIQGNQNALAQLAQYAPEMAMQIQDRSEARDARQQGLAMERQRLSMAQQRLSAEQEAQVRQYAAQQTAEEQKAMTDALTAMQRGHQTGNEAMYSAGLNAARNLDPTFEQIPMSEFGQAAPLLDGMLGVYLNMPVEDPGFRPATPEELAQFGAQAGQVGPDGRFYPVNPPRGTSLTTGPDGSVNFSQGPGVGGPQSPTPGLNKLPAGYTYLQDENGEIARTPEGLPIAREIPGGPQAQEAQQAQEASARKAEQQQLKLGTTLTSLALNIAEIEDGGMPVTGAAGDVRRTLTGRLLTGNNAFAFGKRTDQINDAAAFAEIQNMRDNSPTGGAVGQLTDKEREAIGNAITALNSGTDAAEYLRAARAYRELALNLAYGEGKWRLSEDGQSVTFPGEAGVPEQPEVAPSVGAQRREQKRPNQGQQRTRSGVSWSVLE